MSKRVSISTCCRRGVCAGCGEDGAFLMRGSFRRCECGCHKSPEDRALILLQDFVKECKGSFEKDEEIPGSDAVDYLASLYESAKAIVKKKGRAS